MSVRGVVLKAATVYMNGTDVSRFVREVHMPESYADVDATGMRSDGAMEHESGLYSSTITLVLKSSFGSGAVNEIVRPLFEAQQDFEVAVNPYPLPTTESNPQYQATVRLLTNAEIDGTLGALLTRSLALTVQGKIAQVFT